MLLWNQDPFCVNYSSQLLCSQKSSYILSSLEQCGIYWFNFKMSQDATQKCRMYVLLATVEQLVLIGVGLLYMGRKYYNFIGWVLSPPTLIIVSVSSPRLTIVFIRVVTQFPAFFQAHCQMNIDMHEHPRIHKFGSAQNLCSKLILKKSSLW